MLLMQQNTSSPTLSIGLPVYNGEKFLEQAIRCLLNQTYTDFELIICDNASTDRTQSICEAFALEDRRISYIRYETNGGMIRNFNAVFEASCGTYFKWMAHDDLVDENFALRCIQALQADPEAVICSTEVRVIDAEGFVVEVPEGLSESAGDPLGATRLHDEPGSARGLEHAKQHVRHRGVLIKSTRCYEEFGVIRSEALRKTPLREYYPGSEKVLLTEISLIGKIKVLPEPLMFMRIHDDRLSSQPGSGDRRSLYLAPDSSKRKLSFPPQVRCAGGYWSVIWRQPLPLRSRIGCILNFVRFLLQVRKWVAILSIALLGKEPVVSAPVLTRGPRAGSDPAREQVTPIPSASQTRSTQHA